MIFVPLKRVGFYYPALFYCYNIICIAQLKLLQKTFFVIHDTVTYHDRLRINIDGKNDLFTLKNRLLDALVKLECNTDFDHLPDLSHFKLSLLDIIRSIYLNGATQIQRGLIEIVQVIIFIKRLICANICI